MPTPSLQRITAVALAAVMAASTCQAATAAAIVRSGPDGWTLIDRTGIEVASASVRTAAVVTVKRDLVGGRPGYARTVSDYDCASRKVRWRTFSVYSRVGAKVLTRDNDRATEWTIVPPRSDEELAMRVVCQGGGEAVISAESLGAIVLAIIQSWDQPQGFPALPK
jgi:hypothetical protein